MHRARGHVGDERRNQWRDSGAGECVGHRISGRLHQWRVKRRRHIERDRARAFFFRVSQRRIDAAFRAGDDNIADIVVIGDDARPGLGALRRDLFGERHIDLANQSRHRALADRHGCLHGVAARAQQTRSVRNRERASSGERGIFTKRVTSNERRLARGNAKLALQRTHGGEAHSHQRRLRIGGQRQLVSRAFEDQP